MRSQTAVDKWLSRKTGRLSSADAIDFIVEQNLGPNLQRVPVDPVYLAECFGCSVRFESVPAACVEITKRERVIRIPLTESVFKQRFSIAHELAHLFFIAEDAAGIRPAFLDDHGNSDLGTEHRTKERLETLCDAIARQILVPTAKLAEQASGRFSVNLELLFQFAKEFEVPPDVVFVRLVETKLVPRYPGCILLHFGPNRFTGRDDKWRVAARVMPRSIPPDLFWPNRGTGLEIIGISIPAPHQLETTAAPLSYNFKVQSQHWQLTVQTCRSEPHWALGCATLIADGEAFL